MGNSSSAYLMYGYSLGGDGEWEIEETDEYGEIDIDRVPWAAENEDGDCDIVEQAERRLLVATGFSETDWQVDGYKRKRAVAKLGVAIESYCSGDYPMYVLTNTVLTAHQGHVTAIDFVELAKKVADGGWDQKLAGALRVLGITPKQEAPKWLLCSYWG